MKLSTLTLFTFLAISLFSCHQLTTTIGNYNLPTTINKNPTKMGETCGHYAYPFSMLFSNNDLTVEKARQSANISEIISVEARNRYVYPFYYHRCIIVRGN